MTNLRLVDRQNPPRDEGNAPGSWPFFFTCMALCWWGHWMRAWSFPQHNAVDPEMEKLFERAGVDFMEARVTRLLYEFRELSGEFDAKNRVGGEREFAEHRGVDS